MCHCRGRAFFLAKDFLCVREILRNRHVNWVLAYDWDRVAQNSAALLGTAIPDDGVGRVLDRTPGRSPPYVVLSGQNQTANYSVLRINCKKLGFSPSHPFDNVNNHYNNNAC